MSVIYPRPTGLIFGLISSLLAVSLASCRTASSDNAALQVQNGTAIPSSRIPSVVKLSMPNNERCTGTFLNQTVVLTAAHCVYNVPTATVSDIVSTKIYLAYGNFGQLYDAAKAADWNGPAVINFSSLDQALVIFPPDTASHLGIQEFMPIEKSTAFSSSPVYMVGFGEGVAGMPITFVIKRIGTNQMSSFNGTLITLDGGAGNGGVHRSLPATGDSGGPLISTNLSAPNGSILGTVSMVPSFEGPGRATFLSVQSAAARALYGFAISKGVESFIY